MKLPALLATAAAAAVPLASALTLPSSPTGSGAAACASLTSTLGASKVISSPLDPQYIGSANADYWNTEQAQYHPSCVTYPTSAQDVSAIIKAVRAADSRFAVKAGGHNPNTFFSSVDGGVLIHFEKMTQRTYDPATTLGTYQPGGNFGDIYSYFANYGRTVVGARLGGVGTGLALGGGLSYLSGQYGLGADSFRELEVVLPSGEIVTAAPEGEYSDLFFACKGGGGNAYGIVTKYTIQTRPIGNVFAGNLFYYANQTVAVQKAASDFVQYNTDPKAAIIATYEKFPLPSLDYNLNEVVILFVVYDGEDPGDVYKNFTSIPHFLDTTHVQSYASATNLPIPFATELSEGPNHFRVGAHRVDGGASFDDAIQRFRAWSDAHLGQWELLSIDFQPIPKSLTDASKAQYGGNAMDMPDGPWYWLCYLLRTPELASQSAADAVQQSYADMVKATGNSPGLPLFINDAAYDQNPLATFSTYPRLQKIKEKYDPDNFFGTHTGQWNFDAPWTYQG